VAYVLSDGDGMASKFSKEEAEEGSEIVTQFLRTWASQESEMSGDDVIMADDGSTEGQLLALKRCFEEFRPQIEANSWCQAVLNSL
jgi:DNA mismatch repair protein MSH2